MHNFELSKRDNIIIRSQNYFLKSSTYLTNELFRFGGINSIRGFAENNFQANYISSILTEYRRILSQTLYIHTIFDHAIYKDPSRAIEKNKIQQLSSLGIGLGLLTKNGLLKIAFVNGLGENQNLNSSNTITHISYSVKF